MVFLLCSSEVTNWSPMYSFIKEYLIHQMGLINSKGESLLFKSSLIILAKNFNAFQIKEIIRLVCKICCFPYNSFKRDFREIRWTLAGKIFNTAETFLALKETTVKIRKKK